MHDETAPALTTPVTPVSPAERIEVLDVLRGFALFGILASNLRGFVAPAPVYFNPRLMWTATADRLVQAVLDTLVSGKFITLFAFLFGLGFAVQLGRAEARGSRFVAFYSRRLLVLFMFGVAHALLLWWGDILLFYALTGFLLFFFRKRASNAVLTWAIVLYLVPLLFAGVAVLAQALGAHVPMPPQPTQQGIAETVRIYSRGTWMAMFHKRLGELTPQFISIPFFLPRVLGLFLLGLHAWRSGLLQDAGAHLPLFRRLLGWSLAVGLAGNAIPVIIDQVVNLDPSRPTPLGLLVWTIQSIGVPALSLFFASAVILLYYNERWRARVVPFAAVGRTALTNYLLQTVICTTLSYSYGFGLYGKVGPTLALIPTFIIYGLQIPLSQWWLDRYRFGPVEWLWRSLAYGRRPPMLREAVPVAP